MKKVFMYLLACASAGVSINVNAMEQSVVSNSEQASQYFAQVGEAFFKNDPSNTRALECAKEYLEAIEQASQAVKDYEQVLQGYAEAAASIQNDRQGVQLARDYAEKLKQINPIPLCVVGDCIVKFKRIQGEWRKELNRESRKQALLVVLKDFRDQFKEVHARISPNPEDPIRNHESKEEARHVVRCNLEMLTGLYVTTDLSGLSDFDLNTLVNNLII